MPFTRLAVVSAAALLMSSAPAFADYDGWVAGGMGVYSATSGMASEAKDMAMLKCAAAEGVQCSGAFALTAGSAVMTAHCVSGDMSGYVVGQTESAVKKLIESSAFGIKDCAMME